MTRRSAPASEGRPPAFTYRDVRQGVFRGKSEELLCADAIPLPRLAERYGTPLYVYSGSTIRDRTRMFTRAFRGMAHTVCYSVKANSNLSILRLLHQLGCGFDVVSGGELHRVLSVSRKAARNVVFSGVGKMGEEMLLALRAGILLFNVESESELWRLAECAARARKVAQIALRVNPDVSAQTHPYISTGLYDDLDLRLVSMGFGAVRRGPWLHQYFVGWPYTHGQPEVWERDPASREPWYGRDKGGIYCATQRVDGYLSMDAANGGGTLTTRPLAFKGNRLRLNVHTTGGGSARVALLDAQGKVFPGFSADECEVIQDDAIDYEVRWKKGPDVSSLTGQSVRVQVTMRNAKLYALQFTS